MKYFIGIDPGGSGALVILNNNDIIVSHSTYDTDTYLNILSEYRDEDCIILLEHVHSMFRDGKKQAFSFGWYRGELEGILKTLKFNYICDNKTEPHVWKSALGITSDKQSSIDKFKELFGEDELERVAYSKTISRGKNKGIKVYNDNIVEAGLLAWYGKYILKL